MGKKNKKSAAHNGQQTRMTKTIVASAPSDPLRLFDAVLISPFFVALLVAARLQVEEPLLLILLAAVLCGSLVCARLRRNGNDFPMLWVIGYVLKLGGVFVLYHWFPDNLSLLALYFVAVLSLGVVEMRDWKTPTKVFVGMFCSAVLMCLLPIIGAYSQFHEEFLFHVALFGLVPAGFLTGALLAATTEVFPSGQWRRAVEKVNKKGERKLRPQSLARIYSIAVVIVPALPLILAALGYLPPWFLSVALPLYFATHLAAAYLEGSLPDGEIARRSMRLAAVASVLMFLSGLATVFHLAL